MDYENKKNQQEDIENIEQIESQEKNEFSPEKPLDEIKNVAKEKGEASLSVANKELENNLINYSSEVGTEELLITELEAIQSEAEGKINNAGTEFGQKLENITDDKIEIGQEKNKEPETVAIENKNEKIESTAEQKTKALEITRANFGDRGKIINELKKTTDPEEIKQLKEKLAKKNEQLEQAKNLYFEALSTEAAEKIISEPGSELAIMNEMLIPGLEALKVEESASIKDDNKKTFLNSILKTVGKYIPKNEYARTLAVSTAIGLAGAIPHLATGGSSLLIHTGIKILLAAGGITIGEKMSKFIDKGIEKNQDKKRNERLNKGFDGSLDTMMKLAEVELKNKDREAKIRKVVNLGIHVVLAGGLIGGAELGLNMGHGLAETFTATTKHAGIDIMGDKSAHIAMHKHLHHKEKIKNEKDNLKEAA
jgi:hypothetical protein